MAERVVDLNAKPRPEVSLQLGGRSFRIVRVVTGVRRLYGDLLRETGELLEKAARLQEAEGEELERLSADVEDFAERKEVALFRILELLLTKNGYEFDRGWWEENADENDIKWFIVEAINKDAPEEQKKSGESWAER